MTKAIIMAAGRGVRLHPLTETMPKCLIKIGERTILEHIIYSLSKCHIEEIIIVVGYHAKQVIDITGSKLYDVNIKYVNNDLFDYHACSYSLAIAGDELWNAEKAIILEGDLLMPIAHFKEIVDSLYKNAVIVREWEGDIRKSVIALGSDNIVNRFVYDPQHQNVLKFIDDRKDIIGESLQIWKFTNSAVKYLQDELENFRKSITGRPDLRTGLYSINKVIEKHAMNSIKINDDKWININTMEDVKKAREMRWLKEY